MNKLNIGDEVKIIRQNPNVVDNNHVGKVTGMQLWEQGYILYTVKYFQECSNGGEGWYQTTQVRDGEYELVSNNEIGFSEDYF